MVIFSISLCCPECGSEEWHDMPNLWDDDFCCCNCGTVCEISEMEPALEEKNNGRN